MRRLTSRRGVGEGCSNRGPCDKLTKENVRMRTCLKGLTMLLLLKTPAIYVL